MEDTDFTGANILVVDNDPALASTLADQLRAEGHYSSAAFDGESALSELRANEYDLLIADIVMPGLGGLPLMKEALSLSDTLAVILITGFGDFKSATEAIRSGACELLLKPFSTEELSQAVGSALRKRSDAQELARLRALAPLVRANREIAAAKTVDHLAQEILATAIRETNADGGSLMLIDEAGQNLYIEASRGLPRDVARNARPSLGEGIAGWVAMHHQPLKLDGSFPEEIPYGVDTGRRNISSSLSVPLVAGSHVPQGSTSVLGVVNVHKLGGKPAFAQSDLDLLTLLSSSVSMTLRSIQLFNNLNKTYVGTIRSLASTVDAKDSYTAGHSGRVAFFSEEIAGAMQLEPSACDALRDAGYLHDIGKIGVADAILKKPGRLTEDEFREMRKHPEYSWQILQPVDLPYDIKSMVRHHHERFNGSGYPDGLAGVEIPLGARILAVADAFEAMTSNRPYREAMSTEEALVELAQCVGSQFDPGVVEVFAECPSARAPDQPEAVC